MLEDRRLYLVCPCDAEEDGVLSVLGVRQARAVGDALGDLELWAAYAAPGPETMETAQAVAQRHGLTVRKRPGLAFDPAEPEKLGRARIVKTFEHVARGGPGKLTLVVASTAALEVILDHCRDERSEPDPDQKPEPGSLTEVLVEDDRYDLVRVGDCDHLGPLTRGHEQP